MACGDDAKIAPEPRQRIFDREQRGLQMRGLVQAACVLVLRRLGVSGEHLLQVDARITPKAFRQSRFFG